MAAYQGARRRSGLSVRLDRGPGLRDAALGLLAGRRGPSSGEAGVDGDTAFVRAGSVARPGSRAGRRAVSQARSSWVGVALVTIVIVFAGAFMSLSQSVRVAATSYDIVRLASEHERLEALRADLRSDVERLRSDPAIRKQALDAGLGQLAAPIVVPAR